VASLPIRNGYKGGERQLATISATPTVKREGMEREDLSRRLRVLRAEKGWGLVEAAKIIGISPNTLTDAEHGRRLPSGPTLDKVAKTYGVPLAALFTDAPITIEDRDQKVHVRVPSEEHVDIAADVATQVWQALAEQTLPPERAERLRAEFADVLRRSFEEGEEAGR